MPVRVVIVDPEPFFCEVLAVGLAGGAVKTIGWAHDEQGAERLVDRRGADLVLSEIDLRPGSGLNLVRRLRERVRVVVLTRQHEGDVLFDALDAGAQGCLSHRTPLSRLGALIPAAADGRFVVDPDRLHEVLLHASAARAAGLKVAPGLARLSVREREILHLLAQGLDNPRIARDLYLSPHTVRTHVRNILRKLEVHSRSDAARLALQAGGRNATAVLRLEGPDLG